MDKSDDKVYKYDLAGNSLPSGDFDLAPSNNDARGIGEDDGSFWVVDKSDDIAYNYNSSGDHVSAKDLELTSANDDPRGVTVSGTSMWVTDDQDAKVYKYNLVDPSTGDITFDAASDESSSSSSSFVGDSLTFSHAVGNNLDRLLVVGAQGEDTSSSDCDVTSVAYNSIPLTKIDDALAGTSTRQCVSLWYLLAPPTGDHDIIITWAGDVSHRSGGAISAYNVKQQAPEASNTSSENSGNDISTSVTTTTNGAWLFDTVGAGSQGEDDFETTQSGQQVRYTTETDSSSAAGSTKLVPTAGSSSMGWEHDNPSRLAHVVAAFAPANAPDATTFDADSDESSSSTGNSLTFSHIIGNNLDRLLVVGTQGEDSSSSDCDATGVTFNGDPLIKIDDALAGTSTRQCVSLWYLLAPDTGDHDIIITWAGNVSHRNAGGISAYNVKQQAPEASNTSSENSGNDISTSVTTLTNGAWLFDAVGAGDDDEDDFETTQADQQIRYTTDTSSISAAGSTKLVPTAGSSSMGWEHDHPNRLAHVVAAFAPANPPSTGDIAFDADSDESSSSSGNSLTFSHIIGNNLDRLLVVGAQGEDSSSSDCDVSGVTFNGDPLTKIDDALAGTSTLQCVSLWYLLDPDTGDHDILITWAGNVSHRNGGGISAYNVKQQAPEASNTSSENSGNDITTSVTTVTNGAWLFDAVGAGDDDEDDFEATETGQQVRYTTDNSSSSAAGSTKLVPTAGSSSMGWEHDHPNRLAHVVAVFAPANPPSTDDIAFDGASDQSSSTSNSLTFSHNVGTNSDRLLVVGAQGEDSSSSDCDATGVTYNGDPLIKIDDALAGTSTLQCVSLWYILAPDTGDHDIIITWAGNVSHRNGGGISVYNVKQQAPEASNANSENSGNDITTSVTTLTNGAWLFDAVGAGDDDGDDFEATQTGQQIRYTTDTSSSSAAGSTKLVPTTGSSSMGWEHDHPDRLAHVVAAFAPANTFTGVSGFESSFNLAGSNTDPHGLTTDGSKLWVVDRGDKEVYIYDLVGTSLGSFDLVSSNSNAEGITTDGSFIYVVDGSDKEIYIYNLGGTPKIQLPLNATVPTATTLFNYDTDRDDDPGLTIKQTDKGLAETDVDKFQIWRTGPLTTNLVISDGVIIDFWAATKDFDTDKSGTVSIFLRDYDSSGNYTEIASAGIFEDDWQSGSGGFVKKTLIIPEISHTVIIGHELEIRVIVDKESAEDMWLAYDTTTFPTVIYTDPNVIFVDAPLILQLVSNVSLEFMNGIATTRSLPVTYDETNFEPFTFDFVGDVNLADEESVWVDSGDRTQLKPGVFHATGTMTISSSDNLRGQATFIADQIVLGGDDSKLTPFQDGVLFFATGSSTGGLSVTINGDNQVLSGIVYAPAGTVTVNGDGLIMDGSIFANRFSWSGDNGRIAFDPELLP